MGSGLLLSDLTCPLLLSWYLCLMARPLHIEYHGALYHVNSRGNARQKIFRSDAGRVSIW